MFKKSTPLESLAKASKAARRLFLNARPSDFGIVVSPQEPVWGVVMDIAYPERVLTLIALLDGTMSLYFSSGGGIIGSGQHASVALANTTFVAEAQKHHSLLPLTTTFPYPVPGKVRFYLLTSDGVRTAEASGNELDHGRHELSPLFKKGDDVITAFRLCTQKLDQAKRLAVRDNVMQAILIAISSAMGVLIGALTVQEHLPGMLMGGFLGLVAGFLGSGTLLLVMRTVRNSRPTEA